MRRFLSGCLCLIALLAGPAAVLAEERGPHAPEPAGRVAEDEHGAAAPDAAPSHAGAPAHGAAPAPGGGGAHGGFWLLFLVQVIGFACLLGVGWKWVWPPVRNGLDARTKRFADAFQKAEAGDREVQRQVTEIQDRLRAFPLEAQRRRDDALRQGRALRQSIEAEARDQARQVREKARREGDLLRARARAEVYRTVLDRAFAEAADLLARKMDDRLQATLVDRFVAEAERMPSSLG
jgi:ATP synthase F0 subunit b